MRTFVMAGMLGATAVILGAFGAHALVDKISATSLESYRTAVSYQFYHTLALLFIGTWQQQEDNRLLDWAARLMVVGVVFFSGSIYLLACRDWLTWIQSIKGILGPITPMGGLCFVGGWVLVTMAALRRR